MFAIRLKPKDEIFTLVGDMVVVFCCVGCRELYYPESEVETLLGDLAVSRTDITVFTLSNACNAENSGLFVQKYTGDLGRADTVLIISCGVGVQTLAELLASKRANIIAGADTYPLPGFQGLTPPEYDCVLCGDCHLSDTAGICPITSCSKSLINGQCGGARNGMCEVDPSRECGWEKINKRLGVKIDNEKWEIMN